MTMRHDLRRSAVLSATALAAVLLGAPLIAPKAVATESVDEVEVTSFTGAYLSAKTADADQDIPSAARFYRRAYAQDRDNLGLLERAMVLTATAGDVDKAVGLARTLAAKAPDSWAAHLLIAVDAIRQDTPKEAIDTLREAGTGALADLTNALISSWAKFSLGEVDAALNDIAALDGEEWYAPFKLLHQGLISLASGRTEKARELLAEAAENDPNAVRITEAYARALAIAGEQEEAETVLATYLERMPENALAAHVLEEVRSGKAAEGIVDTAAEGVAEALSGLGAAVGQEGAFDLAVLYLQLALQLDPNSAGGLAALSLGNILDNNRMSDQAIQAYEMVSADAPFRPLAALRTAVALDRADRTEEAEAAFKETLARMPDDVQGYVNYGNMLRRHERFDEAAGIYSKAIDRLEEPVRNDWTLFYFRGIAYERTDRFPLAEADFRKALDLYPDQPLVLNYLGYSWVDKGIHLEEAMDMIRTAVKLRPDDGFIVDSLGWAHYRLGQYEEAVKELERAISLQPDDPVLNDHLGDAYWQLGRELEAQFQWRHARDLGAKSPELDLILRKIAEGRLVEADEAPGTDNGEAELQKSGFYTVKPGDSLWTISAELLKSGEAYQQLFEANRDTLDSPDDLRPGMRLQLPSLRMNSVLA